VYAFDKKYSLGKKFNKKAVNQFFKVGQPSFLIKNRKKFVHWYHRLHE